MHNLRDFIWFYNRFDRLFEYILISHFQNFCLLPCQAPVSRFGDTAANDGALAALEHTQLPTAAKTLDIEGGKKGR